MARKKSSDGGGGDKTATANPSLGMPVVNLKTLIHDHSLFFDRLVELIPARFFLPSSSDDKPWYPGLSKSEKETLKTQTRENIKKSRRARLDPTNPPPSTLDLLKKSHDDANANTTDDEDEEDEDEEDEEEEDDEEGEEAEEREEKEIIKDRAPVVMSNERRVTTYEELQERLRKRIAELSSGRNTRPESCIKQVKFKEKKKNKKKLKSQSKKNREKNKEAGPTTNTGKRKRDDEKDHTFSKKKNKKNKIGETADITFGQVKIDEKENKKRKKKLPKERELERAKKIQEAKKDPEKGKKVSWKTAVSKAAGEKIHDDPKLLKESIKREKKTQKKNAQKWKERGETVKKQREEKQTTRSENIKERIYQKKMRKIEKREKKLMRPGFEGRKEGYVNE